MAEASTFLAAQRYKLGDSYPGCPTLSYAVVTGANKGIGFEICRQLASKGVTVVLTSRDEKRGLDAIGKLKEDEGSAANVVFHQLDVTDPASIESLANFIRTRFGKLDILVNNAGIGGTVIDYEAFTRAVERAGGWPTDDREWDEFEVQNYEAAEEGLQTNYYGAKRVTEALIPLLQQSSSARIVNIASISGLLKNIPGKRITDALRDIESLTKDRIDEILEEFLGDFRQGQWEAKGWPKHLAAYKLSKAALNAYTRLLAKECPSFLVNSVCPGFVRTDITGNNGLFSVSEGAEGPLHLALLPETGPSGLFFFRKDVSPF